MTTDDPYKIIYDSQHDLTFNKPRGDIVWGVQNGTVEIMRFNDNGDIFVKGKLIENDKQVVDALREFLQHGRIEQKENQNE